MFDYSEWDVEFPIINQKLQLKVYITVWTIVDYTLINGKKYLVIQDSWGKGKGKKWFKIYLRRLD